MLRRILPWISIVIAAAVIFDGVIFYSRWSRDQDAQHAREAKEAAQARAVSDAVGGRNLKILGFYVSPGAIHRGQTAGLCYGVNEAKTVKIEPPVGEVWPAMTRCIQISPKKNTEYTLTIEDGAGKTLQEKTAIRVVP